MRAHTVNATSPALGSRAPAPRATNAADIATTTTGAISRFASGAMTETVPNTDPASGAVAS